MDVLIEGWVALPDRPDVPRVVAKWPSQSRWVLAHASGNLWLAGSLDHKVTLASAGPLRVAVIGPRPVAATRLTDLVTGMRTGSERETMAELDTVAGMLPDCFQLVASVDGVVRVQGSVTGMRRVFHTRIQGVPIAGDRADVLARMAGAGAGGPNVPSPVGRRRQWRGVRPLPLDHYLRIDSSGTVGELRWQHRPGSEMTVSAQRQAPAGQRSRAGHRGA